MSNRIYYFSGTGNSLHVARELQKRLHSAELVPLLHLIDRDSIRTCAETVGFVFPQYGGEVPNAVAGVIRNMEFENTSYLFAIATRGGTPCRAFEVLDEILADHSRRLDAFFVLTMPSGSEPLVDNYTRYITPQRIARLETEMLTRLDEIAVCISERRTHRDEDLSGLDMNPPAFMKPFLPLLVRIEPVLRPLVKKAETSFSFYYDEKCSGCGLCEQACLSGKIVMAGEKPAWRKEVKCLGCLACLNFCPEEAVQVKSTWYMKSWTPVNGRYHHPQVTAADIANQKSPPD